MTPKKPPLDWLTAAQGRGIQPGLERMRRLLTGLGNPEKSLRCLHVAGTNGKGSVCAFAESILRVTGLHTGLYTSPHLVSFSERIRIDGLPVEEDKLDEGIRRLQRSTEGWGESEMPTFFELATALAFDLFARAGCEVVVLETGLGGRLDATNTAPKIACAITPIALDHTEWLGETLSAIAGEKAGILRPGVPVVIAPQGGEASEALAAAARKIEAPHAVIANTLPGDFQLGLRGSHQRDNAALALALIRAGGFDPSEEQIREGLKTVCWPGRFQSLRGGSLILDGAHNLHAARQLVETWREEFGSQRCLLLFGSLKDKRPGEILRVLESIASEVFLVPISSPRSFDPMELVGATALPCRTFKTLKTALRVAFSSDSEALLDSSLKETPSPQPPVLLAGSLFLVGEALALQSGEEMLPRTQ